MEVPVSLEEETVWLNREQLSSLFLTDRTAIGRHIRNIYKNGELEYESTCAKIAHVPDVREISSHNHICNQPSQRFESVNHFQTISLQSLWDAGFLFVQEYEFFMTSLHFAWTHANNFIIICIFCNTLILSSVYSIDKKHIDLFYRCSELLWKLRRRQSGHLSVY